MVTLGSIDLVEEYCWQLQDRITTSLRALDSQVEVIREAWQRPEGGGGQSHAFAHGHIFEKGGVNVSSVHGSTLPPSATLARPELTGACFRAVGLSLVLHTMNPYVPAAHANVRYFQAEKPNGELVWWFGGGFDLTPYYGFVEDCEHWHRTAAAACAAFGSTTYAKYKKWCDEYFYLRHRQEARGIGGLFFDDLNAWEFETCFAFMRSVGDHFLPAYQPIIARRQDTPYSAKEKQFQQYRRARYVEFNLVYDRGTLFGLQSGGRTESILVSMPPQANWGYQWQAEPGSREARLQEEFLTPRDWLHTAILGLNS